MMVTEMAIWARQARPGRRRYCVLFMKVPALIPTTSITSKHTAAVRESAILSN